MAKGPVESWNTMVESLRATKQAWETFQEVMLESSANRIVESLDYKAQIWLTTPMVRMSFETALPLLVSKWTSVGGLDEMLLDEESEETKPDKEGEKKNVRTKK